jgi:hypothetical protein
MAAESRMALQEQDLQYQALLPRLQRFKDAGLTETNAFQGWFLENVYRLEEVAARDAICDSPNDKGVDGIYVDDANEEIHIIQTKLRQNDRPGGENDLKNLSGTLQQFRTEDAVQAVLDGGANEELKSRLRDLKVAAKVKSGYAVRGIYVTNVFADKNAQEYAAHEESITVYDKHRIVRDYVDIEEPEGVTGSFSFTTDGDVIKYIAGDAATMYLFPASGLELVSLSGISDQRLFAQNVRLDLGLTPVNKSIRESLADARSHIKFPLFHNGITLLAEKVEQNGEAIKVQNYVVVNGAQSLSSLFKSKGNLSSDLRILLRVVEVGADRELARRITTVSNNQNAIKPRDQRSNHAVQLRLKSEVARDYDGQFYYVVKRGEPAANGQKIENEDAGRWLLAFDVQEPWSTHQTYKIFDDDYAKIFARQQVNADRLVFLFKLNKIIEDNIGVLSDPKIASYKLTRHFLLYAVRRVLETSNVGEAIIANPKRALDNWADVEPVLKDIVVGLITDLDDEIGQLDDGFDYKAAFKSPNRVPELAAALLRSYNKDLRRGRIDNPDDRLAGKC